MTSYDDFIWNEISLCSGNYHTRKTQRKNIMERLSHTPSSTQQTQMLSGCRQKSPRLSGRTWCSSPEHPFSRIEKAPISWKPRFFLKPSTVVPLLEEGHFHSSAAPITRPDTKESHFQPTLSTPCIMKPSSRSPEGKAEWR